MPSPIISVENLGKRYRIHHEGRERYTALRDVIAQKFKRLFHPSSFIPHPSPDEDFWALKDVSFDVKQGEVVGIIGRNGAGKSTLLKILSRITEPTEGRVTLRGRVASLLEVGTGFHPELTGRENIFLNGAILGMRKTEIRAKFDEIVAFAEVEKFLDTPVKRYSSGMYVRLAFAVAAHLEPEILVVDEVLAVGDTQFQKKCLGKMGEVAQGGRTVLFVSHNMTAMQALCTRAVYLETGMLRRIGEVGQLVSDYLRDAKVPEHRLSSGPLTLGSELELRSFEVFPNLVTSGGSVQFRLEFGALSRVHLTELALLLYSQAGARIAVLDFRAGGVPQTLNAGETWDLRGKIVTLPLVEGDYSAGLYLNTGTISGDFLDLASLTVSHRSGDSGIAPYPAAHRGFVELEFKVHALNSISS